MSTQTRPRPVHYGPSLEVAGVRSRAGGGAWERGVPRRWLRRASREHDELVMLDVRGGVAPLIRRCELKHREGRGRPARGAIGAAGQAEPAADGIRRRRRPRSAGRQIEQQPATWRPEPRVRQARAAWRATQAGQHAQPSDVDAHAHAAGTVGRWCDCGVDEGSQLSSAAPRAREGGHEVLEVVGDPAARCVGWPPPLTPSRRAIAYFESVTSLITLSSCHLIKLSSSVGAPV